MTTHIPVRPATAAAARSSWLVAHRLRFLVVGPQAATGVPLAQSPAAADSAAVRAGRGAPAAASRRPRRWTNFARAAGAKAAKGPPSHRQAAGAGGAPAAKLGVPDSAAGGPSVVYTAEETVEVADVSRRCPRWGAAVDAGRGPGGALRAHRDTANMRLPRPAQQLRNRSWTGIGKLGTVRTARCPATTSPFRWWTWPAGGDTQRKSVDGSGR